MEPDLTGGTVAFNPYTGAAADATHTVPDVDSPTSLSVIVPTNAADGKIQVTTFDTDAVTAGVQGGIAFSATNFDVPPPDCTDGGGPTHERSIKLRLRGALTAKGRVSVADDTTACTDNVQVKIQRRQSGKWKTIKITNTDTVGKYAKKIRNRSGKYRALATKLTLENGDVCLKAVSNRVRYRR
jgi:hypothetical protein